jgi:hypothetical protein
MRFGHAKSPALARTGASEGQRARAGRGVATAIPGSVGRALDRGAVPRISIFYGIVIAMYYRDHAPPHFHAVYGEPRPQ